MKMTNIKFAILIQVINWMADCFRSIYLEWLNCHCMYMLWKI